MGKLTEKRDRSVLLAAWPGQSRPHDCTGRSTCALPSHRPQPAGLRLRQLPGAGHGSGRHGRALTAQPGRMWAFLAQLLIALVLLAFLLVSCQNVTHIVRGSVRFLLKHAHRELDKELGESQGLADDEEALSARVVRRRVLLKVTSGRAERAARADAQESRDGAGRDAEAAGCMSGVLFYQVNHSSHRPHKP